MSCFALALTVLFFGKMQIIVRSVLVVQIFY